MPAKNVDVYSIPITSIGTYVGAARAPLPKYVTAKGVKESEHLGGSTVNQKAVGEYMIAGNDFVAIAINMSNPQDAHWFTPGRSVCDDGDVTAWERAEVWASPGE